MKVVALGALCLAGVIAASGCAGGGMTAGALPSTADGHALAGSGASPDEVFTPIEEGLTTWNGTPRQSTARRRSASP